MTTASLTALACRFRRAEREYHTAFRDYLANELAPLSEDRFWQLQQIFVQDVVQYRFGYGRSDGVAQAARELFRKPLVGDFGKGTSYTMSEAARFAKTWRQLSRDLYQPLFDVAENRSDDAFSDLLDALPLAGRQVLQRSRAREYGHHQQLERAVRDACKDVPKLAELILHGENYLAMLLCDAARDYFAIAADDLTVSV